MAPGLLYTTDLKEQNKMREDRVQPKAEHIQGSRSSVWCTGAVGRQWVIPIFEHTLRGGAEAQGSTVDCGAVTCAP